MVGHETQLVGSVVNATRVLEAFNAEDRELGVREIAGKLGLSKSTAHRLLVTLAATQLVEQDPATGRYRLGLRLYALGMLAGTHVTLHEASTPCLTDLRNRTDETVQLAVLDGRDVVYVERLESTQALRLFVRSGYRIPANCSSTGKVLLAHLADDELDGVLTHWTLPQRTVHSIADPDQLRRDLATVRRRGYAVSLNESEVGVASVAAPVRDRTGHVVAAVSLAAPLARMTPAVIRQMGPTLMETGDAISARLGYHRAR